MNGGCILRQISIFLLLAIVSTHSVAGNFDNIFEEHYFNHYEPRQCGKNVLNFVKAVKQSQGDVGLLHVVTIANKGLSVFGMVNAEKARGERFRRPADVEANWYHHVIVLDDSGFVYDFDFGTIPRVIPMEDYLEDMFLNEPECEKLTSGEFCAGRARKLKDYEFSSISAIEAITAQANRVKVASMSKVARDWEVLIR